MGKRNGCYNCMKRRIICDKTEPHCLKCKKKGIDCSGIGVRYRFNDGLASRGKLKGKSIPVITKETCEEKRLEESQGQRHVLNHGNTIKVLTHADLTMNLDTSEPSSCTNEPATVWSLSRPEDPSSTAGADALPWKSTVVSVPKTYVKQAIPPTLQPLDAKTRMFFCHFADAVSPIMILLDGELNGYRRHILPMACEDELLRRAISVCAAAHLTPKIPALDGPSRAGRGAIIAKLRRDAMDGASSKTINEVTWATIILLLIADLVTASGDFNITYKMLVFFTEAHQHTRKKSSLAAFLEEQTQLIEFFAQPILDESSAIVRLAAESGPQISFMRDTLDQCSDVTVRLAICLYSEAYRQACGLFLLRANTPNSTLIDTTSVVERLRLLLVELHPATAGAHALVWVYFVAGAESLLLPHRTFFLNKLNQLWMSTGYANVKVAIETLHEIWARPSEKWTSRLPSISRTIIM